MAIMRAWSIEQKSASFGSRRLAAARGIPAAVVHVVGLWRERHRQRRELALLCARELGDSGVPLDVISREARKWPWQD
jgi:uncharacterized protein YjiS (DUF1127 family)